MDKALILFQTDEDFRKKLSSILVNYDVLFMESADPFNLDSAAVDEAAAAYTAIIFGNPPADLLRRCPRLKWLQLQSAGSDNYTGGRLGPGILLTNASGVYGHAVSEHMTAMTLEIAKKLHLYRDEQAAGRWQGRGMVKSVQGAVVLVVGLGDLGSGYAWRMKGLGAYVIGLRRTAQAKPDYVDEQYQADKLDELLPRADIVCLMLPGTKDSVGLFNRERLAKMKKGAIILNGGRGSAVDTEALCDALESGALDGAGLDVTDPEPLPPEHRLWKIGNAVITPHISGGRNMSQTGAYMMDLNLKNAARFVKGEKLENLVDFKTGYRFPVS
ncbi:MAG: D-2-hydroxyacid dehydrogenase [Treponema sp.]|jgi:phosphoglycerate dehydrogenase-like enzyme|nr:D-2-hydroxyacid dehydrogenase [Treponema sp.]